MEISEPNHTHQNHHGGVACVSHTPPTKEILALFLPPTAPLIADLPKSGKETAKFTRLAARMSHAPPRQIRVRCTVGVFWLG